MLEFIRRNASGLFIKVLFGIIIVVFIFWGVGTFRRGGMDANVVGYVGKAPITVMAYRQALEQATEQMRRQFPGMKEEFLKEMGFRKNVFNQLAESILVLGKAGELGIRVSDQEVREAIWKLPAFQDDKGRFNMEQYKQLLKANGLSEAYFEADMREGLTRRKLRETVTLPAAVTEAEALDRYSFAARKATLRYALFDADAFKAQATASPEELADYHARNTARFTVPASMTMDYLAFTPAGLANPEAVTDAEVEARYKAKPDQFTREEQVRARHILVRVDKAAGEDGFAKGLDKAKEIKKKLDAGMDFAEAAKQFSQDPGSAARGGDLGFFGRGMMVPPFEEAAFAQPAGKVGEPVRSPFGWHIIKVEEKQPAGLMPLTDDLKKDIRQALASERAQAGISELLDEATEQALSGLPLAEIARNLKLKVRSTAPFGKNDDPDGLGLTAEAISALFAQEVGKPAKTPIRVADGSILAVKTGFTPEKVRSLDEVKAQVETLVRRDKAMAAAKAKAEAVLADLRDPAKRDAALAALKADIKVSEPFDRQGVVPGLGGIPDLTVAVFGGQTGAGQPVAGATPGAWLDKPFEAKNGYVVAAVEAFMPPSDQDWQAQKDQWMRSLTEARKEELYSAFLAELRRQTPVEIAQPQLLE